MRNDRFSVVALIGACAAALLVAGAGAPPARAASLNATRSNTQHNVYFRDLSAEGRNALKRLCAEHGGQVVTNDKGQIGCQLELLTDSKNVSDGAAKGQASE